MISKRFLTVAISTLLAASCAGPAAVMANAATEAPPVRSVLALSTASQSEAELLIYGPIGDYYWDGITAAGIVYALNQLNVGTIRVRINSRGGSATEGTAIYNALKRHSARIVVIVDGSAESIASLVAMAGDEVVMPANTLMMIHAPYTPQGGNAVQLDEMAANLRTVAAAMAESYVAKTGKREEIEALLADGKDHYFTAAQCVELGLADRIDETVDEPVPQAAAAAALCSYISAIAAAPPVFASGLRGRIQAAATPQIFASLPEVTQRAVVAHIEDPQMKQQLQNILAEGTTPAPTPAPAPAPIVAAAPTGAAELRAAIVAEQRDRNTQIVAAARPHADNPQIVVLRDQALSDPEFTVAAFNAQAMSILGAQATPAAGGRVVPGEDARDKFRAAAENAIEARAGTAKPDGQNELRGHTLFELARASAERAGIDTRGMGRMSLVANAFTHSSSDFPLLLANTARRALLSGYNDAPEIYPLITRAVPVTDFKATSAAGLGQFSNLDKVPENGEYKFGTFGEYGQTLRIVTFGKMFGISRQAIINDDVGAFTAVPRKMGMAAKRTVGNEVFSLLTANGNLADGVALFHATHRNLGTAAVLSTAAIDALRTGMALQRGPNGETVMVPLKYIVVPVGLGGLARTIRDSQVEVGGSKNLTVPNSVRGTFEVLEDPRLDAHSATAWYGIADPALYDGLIVGYLDGVQEPWLEQKDGWNVDGTEFKVRLDAGAAVADHVALAKNPGA